MWISCETLNCTTWFSEKQIRNEEKYGSKWKMVLVLNSRKIVLKTSMSFYICLPRIPRYLLMGAEDHSTEQALGKKAEMHTIHRAAMYWIRLHVWGNSGQTSTDLYDVTYTKGTLQCFSYLEAAIVGAHNVLKVTTKKTFLVSIPSFFTIRSHTNLEPSAERAREEP